MNREAWLTRATELLEPMLQEHGASLPKRVQVTVGFSRSSKAIGSCWAATATKNGTTHIFICPTLDEPLRLLDVLLHEMIHAAIGVDQRHGPQFRKLARALGLKGKLTATVAGDELRLRLVPLVAELGHYPHDALAARVRSSWKKGGGKRIVLRSTNDPEYWCYMDREMLEEHGAPRDPWGSPLEPSARSRAANE